MTQSSIYDPLAFVPRFIQKGKGYFSCFQDEIGWDEWLGGSIINGWLIWQKNLKDLEGHEINECFKPSEFGKIKEF